MAPGFLNHPTGWRGPGRRIEFALFLIAALLLSIYAAAIVYARFSQAYYDWAFDRLVRDQPAPLVEFVRDRLFGAHKPPVEVTIPSPAPRVHRSYAPGSLVGRLEIPTVGLSVMVLEGTAGQVLTEGVGHIEGTAFPGQAGNSGVAGHRDTFFRALKDIGAQDIITFATLNGTFRYRVEETRVVYPSAVSVLDNSREPTLTLVTCFPFYYVGEAPKRFIVKARLIS
jgi:sortase A